MACLLSSSEPRKVDSEVAGVLMLDWHDVIDDLDESSWLKVGSWSTGFNGLLRGCRKLVSYAGADGLPIKGEEGSCPMTLEAICCEDPKDGARSDDVSASSTLEPGDEPLV